VYGPSGDDVIFVLFCTDGEITLEGVALAEQFVSETMFYITERVAVMQAAIGLSTGGGAVSVTLALSSPLAAADPQQPFAGCSL
jgi:hypothetical protein